MSNKQPRRQRCQPKVYTESEFQRELRNTAIKVAQQNVLVTVAAFALTMHRELGLDGDKIGDLLVKMNDISSKALCFSEIRQELKDETGLDIVEYAENMM